MAREINKVSELGVDLGLSKKDLADIDQEIDNRSLSRLLTMLRVKNKLTQSAMAKKIGVSQSYISKLEHASNDKITFKDLSNCLGPLGYEVIVGVNKPRSLTEKIMQAHRHMLDLCLELQKTQRDDKEILQGLASFEALAGKNILNLAELFINASHLKFKKIKAIEGPQVVVDKAILDKNKHLTVPLKEEVDI